MVATTTIAAINSASPRVRALRCCGAYWGAKYGVFRPNFYLLSAMISLATIGSDGLIPGRAQAGRGAPGGRRYGGDVCSPRKWWTGGDSGTDGTDRCCLMASQFTGSENICTRFRSQGPQRRAGYPSIRHQTSRRSQTTLCNATLSHGTQLLARKHPSHCPGLAANLNRCRAIHPRTLSNAHQAGPQPRSPIPDWPRQGTPAHPRYSQQEAVQRRPAKVTAPPHAIGSMGYHQAENAGHYQFASPATQQFLWRDLPVVFRWAAPRDGAASGQRAEEAQP